ncbi:Anthranilate synthase component 1 [Paraconexibacter sp. AEG42_29]|uniref:Anthranilate synthase component 1 n=1 Tax=Paraconexibacter sp. AEG42_29 TaxID=2997339 RepID=A0AAU7AY48_9ACTN
MSAAASPPPPPPAVTPSVDEVRALAADYNMVPLRHSFIDDCETPVSAFLKLRAAEESGTPAFLLESAEQGQKVGRYSFIGVRPKAVVRWSLGDGGDPYALAAEEVARFRQAPLDDLPPFSGGAVGFFGYDLVRTVETTLGAPNPDAVGLPDMALMLSDVLVIFDHLKHTVTILVNVYAEQPGDVDAAYADALATVERTRAVLAGPVPVPPAHAPDRAAPQFTSNMDRAQFEANVSKIIEYIYAGDAFQVVPSQRWSAALTDIDPFSIYRGLRVVNPSPYMYFLDFLDFQVAGASPEPLLTVSGRTVSTRPIAGTRPRGTTPAEDTEIAAGLLADEKERAEHVMLVDLGRNDLGRVCEYGTVAVDQLMGVEMYSTVMHIVSNVSGQLRPDVSAMDALRSVLPAGTLSGAPKVRAMQIIDEVEPIKRGGYGGAIGYLAYSGDLDTCIHIRTVVMKDGQAHIQAGGGTVADARPDYEYEESVNKAKSVRQAIELAARQPGWS